MSLKIRTVELKHGLILAPMAGVTDRAYRNICRKHGAELVVTEMVSAKALHYNDVSSYELASLLPYEQNSFVQLRKKHTRKQRKILLFLDSVKVKFQKL